MIQSMFSGLGRRILGGSEAEAGGQGRWNCHQVQLHYITLQVQLHQFILVLILQHWSMIIDPKICGWNWNHVDNFNLIIILSTWSDCMVIISNLRSVLGVDRLWRLEQQIQSKLGVRLGLWIYPLRRQIICAWNTENKSRTTCFALFSWVLLLDIHHGSQRPTFPLSQVSVNPVNIQEWDFDICRRCFHMLVKVGAVAPGHLILPGSAVSPGLE